jgi:uncharacterized protein GlcG (DUF336 family)
MTAITLDQANAAITAALAHGRQLGLKPLSVAILDPGGHLVAFQRGDGASLLRPQISVGKASGALALGISSRRIGEMAEDRPAFVGALGGIAAHGIVPAAGGIIIVDAQDQVIGAIGVTGDTSDQDEACALAALAATGLAAQR